jgi:hypothetical protein
LRTIQTALRQVLIAITRLLQSINNFSRRLSFLRLSVGAVVVAIVIWGLTDVRQRARIDPHNVTVHKTDFTVYTEAGAAMFDGRDPYQVANPRGWKYVYPPLFAIVVAPLHTLDPQFQVILWFAISMCLCWGCYRECVRIAAILSPGEPIEGVFGPVPAWIGFAALAAAILPVLNCLQRGQVGVALLYFLLLGFRLLVESCTARRSFLAGVVFALPIVLKATPLLPVVFVLGQQGIAAVYSLRPRSELARFGACFSGTICGLALFLFFVPAAFIGWGTNLHHLDTWWKTVATHEENSLIENFAQDNTTDRNQSLTNAVHHFGNWTMEHLKTGRTIHQQESPRYDAKRQPMDAPLVNTFLLLVRVVLGCLVVLMGYRVARSQDRLGQTVAFSLAYLLTLVVCQIARAHYFMIWFPVVMFTCLWLIREKRPRLAVVFAVVPGTLVTAHYVFLHSAGAIGLLGLGTALWYSAVCLTVLWLCRTKVDDFNICFHTATDDSFCGSANIEIRRKAA